MAPLPAAAWDGARSVPSIPARLRAREIDAARTGAFSQRAAQRLARAVAPLPRSFRDVVDQYDSRAYGGRFSADGTLFTTTCQDKYIRVYNVGGGRSAAGWSTRAVVQTRHLRWTITDTDVAADNSLFVYSSITPFVHVVDLRDEGHLKQTTLDLNHGAGNIDEDRQYNGVWSVALSRDSSEVLAGTSEGDLVIFDLERNQATLQVNQCHAEDVNSCCYLDSSDQVFVSASDDSLGMVWDRRALRGCTTGRRGGAAAAKPVGVLVGHLEGLTHVSTRGDGRYLITNAKDQSIKLWDVRKMLSPADASRVHRRRHATWDYRWQDYPRPLSHTHPNDCSLMTYHGHRTLQTLIRAYFSPLESTGQRYIYCGSQDGGVYIYEANTGKLATVLRHHRVVVRDVSWHPYMPVLCSTSWDGTIGLWSNHEGPVEPAAETRRERDRGDMYM